ncbi:HMG box-containing protein [Fusarium heterosporum]|uniref:HMG box-containing protein n=1 Tax=Fusarium heterosporum TaxID=42747 RepID=A0A8H5WVN1_FUSHE|nr:HMG box-containing protein [Fusarium heterosporum]
MARLAELCPSSDDDLPDLKTLLQKPTRTTRKTTQPVSSTTKSLTSKTTTSSETRRVRRLGDSSQPSANPLFQKWNSEEQDVSQERKARGVKSENKASQEMAPSNRARCQPRLQSLSVEEENIPRSRRQPARIRNRKIIEDSDDESHEGSSSEKETVLTRVRRLQKTKANTATMPDLGPKKRISAANAETKSRAILFAREIDSGTDTEENQGEDGAADEPSIYQTADEESDSGSEPDWFKESPNLPTKKGARHFSYQPSRTNGTGHSAPSIKNPPALLPQTCRPAANTNTGRTGGVAKRTATASDLADTLSKLRLQLNDFSDEDSKTSTKDQFTTPPSTPPKASKLNGLNSPSKKVLIPKTPHRPSMDAFWCQDFVDDWNDQHSPRKLMLPPVTKSPRKASPKKDPNKETKKSFAARKHALAEDFLAELDREITQGKIAELAESTGGVKLVWTKTLNTTAGRANWRRETSRTTRKADGVELSVTYKHHASIELAEKVIDDEHRLLNVMAHEFCHLANFMISGITTNPHGREFKIWAAKCSTTFGDRGIEVTTKHSYDIDFKYVWECDECGTEFKRHSKSIDPQRHRCGSCKGLLKQTRPTPRGAAAGKGPTRYQLFVKEQMAVVRGENPGSPQKVVMRLIAEKWAKQEGKTNSKGSSKLGVESVVDKMVDLTIEGEA